MATMKRITALSTSDTYLNLWFDDVYCKNFESATSNYQWQTNNDLAYIVDFENKSIKRIHKLGFIQHIPNKYLNPYIIIISDYDPDVENELDYDSDVENEDINNTNIIITQADNINTNVKLINVLESNIENFINYDKYLPHIMDPNRIRSFIIVPKDMYISSEVLECVKQLTCLSEQDNMPIYEMDYKSQDLVNFITDLDNYTNRNYYHIIIIGFGMNPDGYIKTHDGYINTQDNYISHRLDKNAQLTLNDISTLMDTINTQSTFIHISTLMDTKLKNYTLFNIYNNITEGGLYKNGNRSPMTAGQMILNICMKDIEVVQDIIEIFKQTEYYDYAYSYCEPLELRLTKYALSDSVADPLFNVMIPSIYGTDYFFRISNVDLMHWKTHGPNEFCTHPFMIPNATHPTYYYKVNLMVSGYIRATDIHADYNIPAYLETLVELYIY